MARTVGSYGGRTEAAIREAAVGLIARRGFEAMSMRQLAQEVGVQAAALYRYFPTKEDLLFSLMREHMDGLIAGWQAAGLGDSDAAARLERFVTHHIAFHVARRHSTHVSNMELRCLSRERLSVILRQRAAYEKELRQILRDGDADGSFTVDDVGLTAMAIIQMITGVIVWFRPDERLSVEEVTKNYLTMTMRLVGAKTHREAGYVRERPQLRAG